jgi:ferric-dicitrate binding protein FerR (iron transport regulator)
MALFYGDSVDTLADSVANITSGGTSILVMPNSSVKLQSNAVELNQGDVAIATSTGMAAKADEIIITPASPKQSKFEVFENDDSVTVAAQQGNVTVSDGQQSSTVQQGQQTTHEKKNKKKVGGAVPCPEKR